MSLLPFTRRIPIPHTGPTSAAPNESTGGQVPAWKAIAMQLVARAKAILDGVQSLTYGKWTVVKVEENVVIVAPVTPVAGAAAVLAEAAAHAVEAPLFGAAAAEWPLQGERSAERFHC